MLNVTGAVNRGLNQGLKYVPPKSAWVESWGWVLLGFGLYLALSCYSFSPFDYVGHQLNARGISNLAGPVGAVLSASFLGRLGIVGIAWPFAFVVWGLLTTMGFVFLPTGRRLLAFAALTVSLAVFAQVQLPRWGIIEPAFGYGGLVGERIAIPMLAKFGYGGTVIALSVITMVCLVLSGNLTISRTAMFCEFVIYLIRKYGRRIAANLWSQFTYFFGVALYSLGLTSQRVVSTPAPSFAGSSRGNRSSASTSQKAGSSYEEVSAPRRNAPQRAPSHAETASQARANQDDANGDVETAYGLELTYRGPSHERPSLKLFARSEKAPPRGNDFKRLAALLTSQLREFKVEGRMTDVVEGPVVTTFEFEPAPGTKVAKIAGLGEDLARLLSAKSLRVLAPIPGKNTVGFEVPNAERRTIGFGDLIDNDKYRSTKLALPIAMGVDIFGKPVIEDLAEMPHLLVAGSTGSGKSVFMNTLIGSLITRHTARDLRLIMIDPKMVEMAAYNPLPHMACEVVTDAASEAKAKLDGLVVEMEDRYQRMRALGAKNIKSFNETIRTRRKSEFIHFDGKWQAMPYVVLIIDELADMMMVLGKDAEQPITRLAQKARAAGIHLVIATQRPSADVVTGLIKANFPTRVAFRVLSGIDSRTILDTSGAETLLGKGDMLYLSAGGMRRIHGAYLSDNEVTDMVASTKVSKR